MLPCKSRGVSGRNRVLYSVRSYHELNTPLEPKLASKVAERGKADVRASDHTEREYIVT